MLAALLEGKGQEESEGASGVISVRLQPPTGAPSVLTEATATPTAVFISPCLLRDPWSQYGCILELPDAPVEDYEYGSGGLSAYIGEPVSSCPVRPGGKREVEC